MTHDDLLETIVAERVLHRGRYLTLRRHRVRDSAGGEHEREVVEHPGAVAMLALLGEDLLLVRQYRTAAAAVLLEIPAGTLDRLADGTTEDADVAAPRELGEETGYRAARWRKLGQFWTVPGFASELMHLYLARDLSPIEDYAGPMHDEPLRVERLPWREVLAMADRGEIEDAKTLVGIFWLARLAEAGELRV